MPVEMEGGGGMTSASAAGASKIDPSSLHLQRELSRIRKAARVFRDPGTSSSWRSPLSSSRSVTKHHYLHHRKSEHTHGNEIVSSFEHHFQSNTHNLASGSTLVGDKGNVGSKEREKKVFLCNWRSQKSESESKQVLHGDDDCNNNEDDIEVNSKDGGSISASLHVDSSSDSRHNASDIFRCKDANFTPSIMRRTKKTRRMSYSSSAVSRHHTEKLQNQIMIFRRGELARLVDQSDDTEEFCRSPSLTEFKNNEHGTHTKISLASHRRNGDAQSTPALSTSSRHNNYMPRKASTVESWDAATGSFADDEVDPQLDFPSHKGGCGIPCYNWSRRPIPKLRPGYGSCCSPSLSDTLLKKGSSIFCGAQPIHQRRHHSNKRSSRQGLVPLLASNGRRESSSVASDDELSMNLWELDLEALSCLDGRRWSTSCRSQEGLEIVTLNENMHEESSPENVSSLSHKYVPMFFEELIGQNLVVQSLKNAVSRKRVAPVYLFHGPRGTGKSSAARVFGGALNCLALEENSKPCGICRECADFVTGKSTRLVEADGSSKTGIEKIKNLLKTLLVGRGPSIGSEFTVFVVDECHLLPSRTWLAFLRLVEKPLPHVVFVLVTSDADSVPRAVLSRCQKHAFSKIGCGDIVARLRKIGNEENLDVEVDALEMIALNVDGSLRDAETMLEQLSLFGKRISVSLVNELIGVVSDEKLLELLELAMSSNATETVIRARELMDFGADPMVLMSQMATLIVDIIAGTYPNHHSFLGGRNLSERELDRLKNALNLLSEAEKHLRVSSERSTWFTATLLQLGSLPASSDRAHSKATDEDHTSIKSTHRNSTSSKDPLNNSNNNNNNNDGAKGDEPLAVGLRCVDSKMLGNVWAQCVDKCHSKTLRQLLHSHGRLVSISEVKGGLVAQVGFLDQNIKSRAEGFLSSITNSFETVLRRNVEIQTILLPDSSFRTADSNKIASSRHEITEAVSEIRKNPGKRMESIIHEQRLETAWLQAADRGTPRSAGILSRPERNQVLPQDGMNGSGPLDGEINALKVDHYYAISPSVLHNSSFTSNFSRDNMGYESGSGGAGCGAMFCWNNGRTQRSRKTKPGTPLRGHKSGRFSWLGECAKSRRRNRFNR